MNRFVLDASIAAAWLFDDEDKALANAAVTEGRPLIESLAGLR